MSNRILVAGDTHGDLPWITTLAKLAQRHACDQIVVLGDFGLWVDRRHLAKTGEAVLNNRWLSAVNLVMEFRGVECTFIDGNHDNHPQARAEYPADPVTHIRTIRPHLHWADRGAAWSWSGVRFGALGGASSIDRASRIEGISWWPTENITFAEMDRFAGRGHVDVLLTHDAPAQVPIPLLYGGRSDTDPNRRALTRAVEVSTPRLLLHGHHHVRYSDRIEGPGPRTRIEGFAANIAGDGRAWGVLDLGDLTMIDGRSMASKS